MKFKKPEPAKPKKKNVGLSDKTKFKAKESAAKTGTSRKGVELAASLLRKGQLKDGPGDKPSAKGKNQAKKHAKQAKLSPQLQLGLKLDQLLETKTKGKLNSDTPARTLNANASGSTRGEPSPAKSDNRKRGKAAVEATCSSDEKALKNGSASGSTSSEPSPAKSDYRKTKKGKKAVVEVTWARGGTALPLGSDGEPADRARGQPPQAPPGIRPAQVSKRTKRPKQDEPHEKQPKQMKSDETGRLGADALDPSNFSLDSQGVRSAVESLVELHDQSLKSNKLLNSEPGAIFLKLLFYLPSTQQKTIRFDLEHSLVQDTSDICLFASDLVKKNPEESKLRWEEILKQEGVKCISEVITLKSLISDYSQFQDKRKLSDRFDWFLVDGRISHRVFGLLTNKFFHSRRKSPFPINLVKTKMAQAVQKALSKTVSHCIAGGEAFSVQVGHTGMSREEIVSNVVKVWEQYPQQFGVYWENIRKASLMAHQTPEMPVFCSVSAPPGGKPRPYRNMTWTRSNVPVAGELSTVPGRTVLVYPSGAVVVKDGPKPKETAEEIQERKDRRKENRKLKKAMKKKQRDKGSDLDSDDDLGGRRDMLESEGSDEEGADEEEVRSGSDEGEMEFETSSDEESSPPPVKGYQKKGAVKVEKEGEEREDGGGGGGRAGKRRDVVDRAELEYLQQLAADKEKSESSKKKQVKKKSDSDEEIDDDKVNSDDENPWYGDDSSEATQSDDAKAQPPTPEFSKPQGANKGGLKMNKFNKANGAPKGQGQRGPDKPGATKQKSPQSKKQKGKKNKPGSPQLNIKRGRSSGEERGSGPAFQGTTAQEKRPKGKRRPRPMKNRATAGKLAD